MEKVEDILQKKISVIIPVFNTESYISKCLDSLLGQTYTNLEIVVVDDGSTDGSWDVIQSYSGKDSRIKAIRQLNQGVSKARNNALSIASGDYISFVDSDDWLDLNTYENIMCMMNEYSAEALFFCWMEEYADGSSYNGKNDGKLIIPLDDRDILKTYFENNIYLRISSGVIGKNLISDFAFSEELKCGEDMLFTFQLLSNAHRVVYYNAPFYHRYNRFNSATKIGRFDPKFMGLGIATDRMLEYVKKNRLELVPLAVSYSLTFYMELRSKMLYYGCIKEYPELFERIENRRRELWTEAHKEKSRLKTKVLVAYVLSEISDKLFLFTVNIYYKHIKRTFAKVERLSKKEE